MRNLYKVLGIVTTADDQRIKTAFRRRVKTVHPDLNPGNQRAEARFIELMQAYEVLSNAGARADYDAYLADRRRQSRHRLVHCAGLMMTSFMLTAASAIFVMSLAGANVPFRETWQMAVATLSPVGATEPSADKDGGGWSTQVAVSPGSDGPAPVSETKLPRRAKAEARSVTAASKAPAAKSRPDIADTRAKGARQQVATAPKPAPATVKRPEPQTSTTEESWPPMPPPADEPRYSLGASDLR